jgi:hypothetical protein
MAGAALHRPAKQHPAKAIGRMRLILVLVGAVIGGGLSISATLGEILQMSNPAVAASMWPANGFALNAAADAKLDAAAIAPAGNEGTGPGSAPAKQPQWSSIKDIAGRAFLKEPLNASALRSLALSAQAAGNGKLAATLMADAVKFSRRDTAANNWQLRQALSANDLPQSLRLVDRILREDGNLRSRYIPVLIAGVEQAEGFTAIYPLLVKQPVWEAEFWSMAASQPGIPPQMSELRQKLFARRGQRTPMIPFLVTDVHLIRNLIRNDAFDAAKSLHSYLSGQNQPNGRTDSTGRPQTDFTAYDSPLDWQFTTQGDTQAYVDDTGTGVVVETGSNSIGVFARHLVRTENGRFALSIAAKPVRGTQLFARLKCAEKSKRLPVVNIGFAPDSWNAEQSVGQDCRWYILELLAQNTLDEAAIVNIGSIAATSVR